jgi:alpha-ribazole phosphatase
VTPTRFFLVRHALVEPSARAVLYGSMDVALCDLALRQEAAAYRWLAHRLPQPARWFVTTLSRTRFTAAAIFAAGYPDAAIEQEPDLVEQHLGDWQGIPHEALPALLTHPAHPFWPHGGEEHPPGGESFREVQARVAAVMERMATLLEGQDVVIIAHGGVDPRRARACDGADAGSGAGLQHQEPVPDADREARAGLARRRGQ